MFKDSSSQNQSKLKAWLRWGLFSESIMLLLALAGPGFRYSFRQSADSHDLFASWFIDDPGYLTAVLVNLIAIHLFIGGAWLLARIATKNKKQ